MSFVVPAVSTLSEAWLGALEHVLGQPKSRAVHVILTVAEPGREVAAIRTILDDALSRSGAQPVDTVAETIFPRSLYDEPGFEWSPDLPPEKETLLDVAASGLYQCYSDLLPTLMTVQANNRGTYFSRMITWPGTAAGGTNQLDARVQRLRSEHRSNRRTHNTLDMDIAADAVEPLRGVQVYAATDNRTRAFPCLTHIDLTLHDATLHCAAVYRHHYLVQKAYGNLLGLSWMMQFLCDQSGFALGELVVHATLADAEPSHRSCPRQLVVDARSAVTTAGQSVDPTSPPQ